MVPLQAARPKHIRTQIYTPKTNGKAKRLIQTGLHERAYARATPPQTKEPVDCRDGFTATIRTGRMAVSARCPPLADPL